MSYAVYVEAGANGSVTFSNDDAGSTTISAGNSQYATGYGGNSRFTATPNSGYEFSQWTYRLEGYSSTAHTSTSNPLDFSSSSGSFLVVRATFVASSGGGGSGGDEEEEEETSDYRWNATCYDITNAKYISGYEQNSDSDNSFYAPSISGYEFKGYTYYTSYADCVDWYYSNGYDGTTSPGEIIGSNTHMVFFYEYTGTGATETITVASGAKTPVTFRVSASGTYTIYTEGSLDTIGYLTYASVTSNPESNYIAYNDDASTSNRNFSITATLSTGTYKIWVGAYGSNSGTTTLHISPKTGTFTGSVGANGTNTATVSASFKNGDAGYAYGRYIRVKIGSTWWTSYISENDGTGGATSTFSTSISGLSANTTYSYEVRLYYNTGSRYVDTYLYVNGTFTTNQSATGLMIYVNGWKDAIPYVYTSSGWKRAYSRMYINGWKGS